MNFHIILWCSAVAVCSSVVVCPVCSGFEDYSVSFFFKLYSINIALKSQNLKVTKLTTIFRVDSINNIR